MNEVLAGGKPQPGSLSTWQLTAVQLRRPISLRKSREFTPMDGFLSLKWSPNPIVYAVFIGIALILSARNLYIALDDRRVYRLLLTQHVLV